MVRQAKKWIMVLGAAFALCLACEAKKMNESAPNAEAASEDKLKKFFPDEVQLPTSAVVEEDSAESSKDDSIRITKLEIFPAILELVEGTSKALRVTAVYSDGEKRIVSENGTWSSNNNVVGRFDKTLTKGTVVAVAKGVCELSFTIEGVEAKAQLTVTEKALDTIEIEPKIMLVGENTKFSATAIFTDGSHQDITSDVTWQSQNTSIAAVVLENSAPMIRGLKVGTASITAVYQGYSGQNRVKVVMPDIERLDIETDSINIIFGSRPNFKAIATLKSGNVIDVTSSVTWACDNANICEFSSEENEEGVLNVLGSGITAVTALYDASIGSLDITVTNTSYISYEIEPANTDVPINLPVKFTAYGNKADGGRDDISNYVIWSVSNEFIAVISNDAEAPGTLTGLVKGDLVIGARYGDQNFTTEATVVSGALVEIVVSSTNPTGTCGVHEAQFTAKGKYSDNSEQDISALVTWSSADPALASVSNASENKGKVTTFKKGSAYIRASLFEPLTQQTIMGQSTVTATDPILVGYTITPQKSSVAIGEKVKMFAKDQFSCEIASPTDRTNVVTWESGDLNYLAFDTPTMGEARTYGEIAQQTVVRVTASLNGLSGTFDYPIRVKELTSVTITSDHNISWLEITGREQFRATAVYSNGSEEDVTDPINLENHVTNWSVNMVGLGDMPASIDNDTVKGELLGLVEGTIDVKAVVTINSITKNNFYRVDIVSRCIGGVRSGLYCWYLGAKGQNCEAACTAVGANHVPNGTISYVGSAGNGSNCTDAMMALGIGGTLADGLSHPQNKGIGCAVYSSAGLSIPKRFTSPDTNSLDTDSAFKRVCSCDQ